MGATVKIFREDPSFVAEWFNRVRPDGDQEKLMVALRNMAEAVGGVPKLPERAEPNATTLYRTLLPKGNP